MTSETLAFTEVLLLGVSIGALLTLLLSNWPKRPIFRRWFSKKPIEQIDKQIDNGAVISDGIKAMQRLALRLVVSQPQQKQPQQKQPRQKQPLLDPGYRSLVSWPALPGGAHLRYLGHELYEQRNEDQFTLYEEKVTVSPYMPPLWSAIPFVEAPWQGPANHMLSPESIARARVLGQSWAAALAPTNEAVHPVIQMAPSIAKPTSIVWPEPTTPLPTPLPTLLPTLLPTPLLSPEEVALMEATKKCHPPTRRSARSLSD